MLAPTNLQPSVVDHETLQIAQSIERSCRSRINKGDKADMLVGYISNVVQKPTPNDITNFFDGRLRVDVSKINSPVSKIVDSASCGGYCGCCNRLLGQCIRDEITICTIQNMSITRSNTKILCCILLLCLGDICATILSIVDFARCLPLCLLRKLGNSLDGITDGQEVNKANCLFTDNLDSVNRTELAQILTQLFFSNVFRQITEVDVARCTRLLHS